MTVGRSLVISGRSILGSEIINAGTDATIGSRPVTKWRSCSRAATCAALPGVTLLAPASGAGGGGGGIGVTTEAELILASRSLTGASDEGQDAATNACASGSYLRVACPGVLPLTRYTARSISGNRADSRHVS